MQITVAVPADFDFRECVDSHGWRSLAPFSWDPETGVLERAQVFSGGDVGIVRVSESESGELIIAINIDVQESELSGWVRRMLQLDLPLERFYSFCAGEPKLRHVPSLKQGRLLRSPSLFEDVVKVIATTNTTWAQTRAMVARIVSNFGSPVPGDPLRRAFPTPEQIANVPLENFGAAAKLGYRNTSVHRIAVEITNGRLDLESLQDPVLPAEELYRKLMGLPGIGPYAASCLMIYLGRYDRVNVDSWARMMVGKELGRKVTDSEVHAFFEPFGEWKALAYHFYPWREDGPAY